MQIYHSISVSTRKDVSYYGVKCFMVRDKMFPNRESFDYSTHPKSIYSRNQS